MAGEDAGGRDAEMRLERGAELGKELLEDSAHGEDGRARVNPAPGDARLAHLAAGTGRAFHHRDREALLRQQGGGGKAADSGSDQRDAMHAALDPC